VRFFRAAQGSKIAFIDKTVKVNQHLSKLLLTNLNNEGDIKLGHNVQVGYFAQNQAEYLDGRLHCFKQWKTRQQTLIVQRCGYVGIIPLRGDDVEKR
jgi:ATP-binding cassette subfamily F protein 3